MKLFYLLFQLFLLLFIVQARQWLVGSASSSILPTILGRTDYVKPVPESDATSPGTLTPLFDAGKINVGNGGSDCKWVRDDLRATVVAIRVSPKRTLVVLSADLYMFFKNDLEKYWGKTRDRVKDRFGELHFLTHATHNHHGPDTMGGGDFVNTKYYEYLENVMINITEKALYNMRPAKIHIAEKMWAFGLGDSRDPRLMDKKLRIMQATSLETGKVIATVLQWTCHPEVTLGYSPKVDPAHCRALGRPENCSANGLYFTADFPGHIQRVIREKIGGDVCYITGSVGLQMVPKRDSVWEVSEKYPITGDGSDVPPGAPVVPRNFRMTLLMGRELALAALNELKTNGKLAEPPEDDIVVKTQNFYTRVTNIVFKIGMVPIFGRARMGVTLRKLYLCTNKTHPSDDNCKEDGYKWQMSDILLPKRVGEFIKSQVTFADFGNGIKFLSIPGEMPGEYYTGLPSDFNTNISKYYNYPDYHAHGENYKLPGVLHEMMKCSSCWLLGLTNDELGYMVPQCDWRQGCHKTFVNCTKLPLEYGDSMSGKECEWLVNNEEEAKKKYGTHFYGIRWVCINGQITQANHHYEETNSAGWNFANDYFATVRKLVS